MRFIKPDYDVVMPSDIDASKSDTFRGCNMKYAWRYVWHLIPITVEKPLVYGGALHDGLAEYYDWLVKVPNVLPDLEAVGVKFLNNFEQSNVKAAFNADRVRTIRQGVKALIDYGATYTTDPQFVPIDVEKGFALEIPGEKDVIYCGRLDTNGIWTSQNRRVILEHKHTTRFGDSYFRQFNPSMQMEGYFWAGSEMFENFLSVVINVIVIHGTSKKNPEGETLFHRQHFQKPAAALAEFKLDLQDLVVDMKRAYDQMHFPRNRQHCEAWYRECPYRILCISPSEKFVRKHIELNFETSEWHPYKTLVKGEGREEDDK